VGQTDLVFGVASQPGEVNELELNGGDLGRAAVWSPARRVRRVIAQVHVTERYGRAGLERWHQPITQLTLK